MKCAPSAADSTNTAMAGLMVWRHASSDNSAVVSAAIISPKLTMNSAPRGVCISGKASKARHSGQLQTLAIHRAARRASVVALSGLREAAGAAKISMGGGVMEARANQPAILAPRSFSVRYSRRSNSSWW